MQVRDILNKVREDGDKALEFYTKKFDHINLPAKQFSVSRDEMQRSYNRIPQHVKSALLLAKRRIEFFHKAELKRIGKSWVAHLDGVSVGQKVSPLSKVGIYVPGGRYCYPSTVLMTAVPARLAGVKQIVMVTPLKNLKDEVLAAAFIAGVDRCFTVGGPAAIAALAYGTRTIPKVDKIVGPGNQYVTEAKRQIFGEVGIDGLAGPSEVAVWADSSSDSFKIALNLLAQAEHGPDSKSFLFTTQKSVLSDVKKRIQREFLRQIKFVYVQNESAVIEQINAIAPEHLYLAIRYPKKVLSRICNAGAIFLGENSPVALGDYVAGPSHVLPTGKSAKFSSGLSVKDFLKWSSVIENKSRNSSKILNSAKTIAEVEGLHYHSLSLMQ